MQTHAHTTTQTPTRALYASDVSKHNLLAHLLLVFLFTAVSTHFETKPRSGTFPIGFTNGHHDIAVQTGQSVQSAQSGAQYGSSLKVSQFDSGLKTNHYDMNGKLNGQYDSLKSGMYDSTVTSDHYDSGIIPGIFVGTAKAGQYNGGAKSSQQQYEMTTIRSSVGQDSSARSGYGYDGTARSGQYDSATLDASALPLFNWSTNALLTSPTSATFPASANMAAATTGSTSSYVYQSSTNNMGGTGPIIGTTPSSLSGESARKHGHVCHMHQQPFLSEPRGRA